MRVLRIKEKLAILCLLMTFILQAHAQQKARAPFDPHKFEVDLEQYITTNAGLSPREAAAFFPVYRQMMTKMRSCFDEMRRFHRVKPKDNDACAEAIRKQDEIDIEMKLLQQEYHQRFMTILSPSKVLAVIKAEEKFHRQAFKRVRR